MSIKKIGSWLWKRVIDAVTLWPVLVPAGAVGVMTGYLASFVDAVSRYGAFGWWVCGLASFALAAFAFAAVALARSSILTAQTVREWSRKVDAFNPMDREFRGLRMKVADLAHPVTRRISRKRIIDCDLIGPANIFLRSGSITGSGFMNCDFVPVLDQTFVQNIIVAEESEMLGCTLYNCTIFMPEAQLIGMANGAPGTINVVSRTGDVTVDANRIAR